LTKTVVAANLHAPQTASLLFMANTKSAAKRSRQTEKRSLRNRMVLTRLRKMQRTIATATGAKDETSVRELISAVDKAAKRGIVHRNTARRRKARLTKALRASRETAAAAE
jgi:small subunit ribosomal protein S20